MKLKVTKKSFEPLECTFANWNSSYKMPKLMIFSCLILGDVMKKFIGAYYPTLYGDVEKMKQNRALDQVQQWEGPICKNKQVVSYGPRRTQNERIPKARNQIKS